MPSRNIVRKFDSDSAYHIYNRGVAKANIFVEGFDYDYFLRIIDRHLNPDNTDMRGDGIAYEKFDIDIIAYCLMDNHFHFLIYQRDPDEIKQFMKSVMTAYSMYFNKKYDRVGPIFQGKYRARLVADDADLLNLTRYINMNSLNYKNYTYSSYYDYVNLRDTVWVKFNKLLDINPNKYKAYLESYEEVIKNNPEIKAHSEEIYDLN